jgi:hypothetical protein
MISTLKLAVVTATVAGTLFAGSATRPAYAGLVGDSVNVTVYFPNLSTPADNTGTQTIVAGGTVFNTIFNYNVTVSDTTIKIGPFGFTQVEDIAACNCDLVTDLTKNLPDFTVDASTNVPGFTNANLSEPAPNELAANFSGLSITAGEIVLLDAVVSPVPAPLIGSGFPVLLAVGGVLFGAKLLERGKKPGSLRTALPHAAAS